MNCPEIRNEDVFNICVAAMLRHYRGLPLMGSPNRYISDFANAPSKFLASLGTSDTLETLGDMHLKEGKMANVNLSRERRSSLLVVGVLLILGLGSAIVLFYFMDSFAQIQNKGVSLGGAAAGFVVIFLLLRNTYFRVTSTEREFKKLSTDEKIKRLETQIEQLIISKLDNFVVPEGYKSEVSKEFQFGFCYPEDWEFSRFPQQTQYGFARDLKSAEKLGFARNMNVIITDISSYEGELDEIYESNLEEVLRLMPNAKLVFKENFLFQGLPARKYRVDWVTNLGEQLALYQILVADKDRKNLYIISFTTTKEDFNSSRVLFDNIAGTFRI